MKNYYVKPMIYESVFDYEKKYGIFTKRPEDPEKIHCKDEDANLVLWTHDELIANKIAELLDVDDYINEMSDK